MASYLYKLIPSSEISSEYPYCFRQKTGEESLCASIRKYGLLQPLIVTPSRTVISGYRRLEAARTLSLKEVPALTLEEEPKPQDAFLLAVLSNWHQPFSEIEKAKMIVFAKEKMGFQQTAVVEELFPAMKMSPDKGFYEEALEVMALQPALLGLIISEKMPFRGSRILSRFSADDQHVFAGLAEEVSFTTNQLLKIGEWLYDLLKIEKLSLRNFLEKYPLEAVLKSNQPRNSKGERVFSIIRALRFPRIAEKEKQFSGLSEQLRDEKAGLSVELPPFFEGEGFTLKARLSSPEALDAVIQAIQAKRKVLNSLLDIML